VAADALLPAAAPAVSLAARPRAATADAAAAAAPLRRFSGQQLSLLGSPAQAPQPARDPALSSFAERRARFEATTTESAAETAAEVYDDSFALPPAVVEIHDDGGERFEKRPRWASIDDTEAVDSQDSTELDADADEVPDDMVRSPDGTSWVKASRFFKLDTAYTIWFDPGQRHFRRRSESEYEECLQRVGTFSSVQDFWRYWNAIDLAKVGQNCSLSLFKDPIKPMWEDPGNQDGGQWIFRCNDRSQAEDYFTKLALALIGGYFECHESVCGVVWTTKPKSNSLGIWGSKTDRAIIVCMDCELRELLGLESEGDAALVFKGHKGVRVKSGENGNANGGASAPVLAGAPLPASAVSAAGAPAAASTAPAAAAAEPRAPQAAAAAGHKYGSNYKNGSNYPDAGGYPHAAGYPVSYQYVPINGGGYTYVPCYQGTDYTGYGVGDGSKGALQAHQWWG